MDLFLWKNSTANKHIAFLTASSQQKHTGRSLVERFYCEAATTRRAQSASATALTKLKTITKQQIKTEKKFQPQEIQKKVSESQTQRDLVLPSRTTAAGSVLSPTIEEY